MSQCPYLDQLKDNTYKFPEGIGHHKLVCLSIPLFRCLLSWLVLIVFHAFIDSLAMAIFPLTILQYSFYNEVPTEMVLSWNHLRNNKVNRFLSKPLHHLKSSLIDEV